MPSFIPPSHPRYESLMTREKLVEGFRAGIVVPEGLIAHGRGEAFDYILGETSRDFAIEAAKVAAAMMLAARRPVISVNGNAAALAAEKLAELSRVTGAPLEVNLFHWSRERADRIKKWLERFDCEVLAEGDAEIEGIEHCRRIVDSRGILVADVVLVALEDGDRCEVLRRVGKKVIAIDLNPLSRTAQMADVTVVDNVTRAIPNIVKFAREMKELSREELEEIFKGYDNGKILKRALEAIREYLTSKSLEASRFQRS
ncbi:4-phosphopantoate--beta-alanine ligase [Archaeoglobus veneficus]|uniref:4-phosphopantoate--beta-alanine ligase n=1 Tax=Archaeoglobus veneficus (strain DSM 11195 / SNP6) TaxID=693661 RepID=F2KMZ6_ARCVS|nr:4-phosphopantoate--beta-alanine ligase [Archaeoglobus veneficus]AEA47272.1 protein of unknown function DUF137 [Archaeoglobus veneficus SNP6]